MSTTIDLGQGAELRVAGSTVGVFLPEAKLRELIAERDTLRRELEEARRQLEGIRHQADEYQRLQGELNEVKRERDRYAESLTAVMRDVADIDEEKAEALIAEAESNGVDFAEVVREVEGILYKKGGEGHHAG